METEVRRVFSEVQQAFGALDVLVNDAGISGADKPTDEITEEQWDQVMAVNVKGVFLCTKHAVPLMPAEKPHQRARGACTRPWSRTE